VTANFWSIRVVLEDLCERKLYGRVTLRDGTQWVFLPCFVNVHEATDGEIVWHSTGLFWRPERNEDDIGGIRFDRIATVEYIDEQPPPHEDTPLW
jgi:hypothetical protein